MQREIFFSSIAKSEKSSFLKTEFEIMNVKILDLFNVHMYCSCILLLLTPRSQYIYCIFNYLFTFCNILDAFIIKNITYKKYQNVEHINISLEMIKEGTRGLKNRRPSEGKGKQLKKRANSGGKVSIVLK